MKQPDTDSVFFPGLMTMPAGRRRRRSPADIRSLARETSAAISVHDPSKAEITAWG